MNKLFQNQNRKIGNCEVCKNTEIPISLHYGNMWFCDGCWGKEELSTKTNQSPEKQQERVDALQLNNAIKQSRQIDESVQIHTDLFNAETMAIVELKKAIDSDESIVNKPFALAEEILKRFQRDKELIFNANQAISEAGNRQKAAQVYLNQLANQLRSEEREKLRLADISYKPSPPKLDKPKAIKTAAKKIDKVELRKYAAELSVSEFTLQMLVVSKGISVEAAANMLRRSIKEAQSESN